MGAKPVREIIIMDGVCVIPCGNGLVAYCDESDYELVRGLNWIAYKKKAHSDIWYVRSTKNNSHPLHRVIMGVSEKGRSVFVDHFDHDGLNNKRSNLRVCTPSENNGNQRLSRSNTSGKKGVSFCKGTGLWRAQIKLSHEKTKHLGRYTNIEDASKAYAKAAHEKFGEFAYVG